MYFTVYKIINKINNKYYIGKHQTIDLNDGYMGSGKLLKRAIKKYGVENFTKEILFVFDNEQNMNDKEKELVIISEETYNLCEGGKGGFGYINANGLTNTKLGRKNCDELLKQKYGVNNPFQLPHSRKIASENMKKRHASGEIKPFNWKGRKHKESTKKLIGSKNSIHQTGKNNSQYGTCWMTNGTINKKITKSDIDIWLKMGFYKGRKMKNKGG